MLQIIDTTEDTQSHAPNLTRPIANSLLLLLLLSIFISRGDALPVSAIPPIPWNSNVQGGFITALCADRQGHIWAGTEDWGVWEWNGVRWIHFTVENTHGGLGDADIYSLTCDKLGRIWAGTDQHGVCVFNGKAWRDYDRVTGPLGCHVIALTTSPLDGDVWGATEAGLFRYSLHDKIWAYYTRADGLPSDQADSLAFSKSGTLFVGTLCNGIAIGSPSNDYRTWKNVTGTDTLPNTPGGPGLPTNQINCLLVTQGDTVYAGTTTGLAHSSNNGKTWSFIRGADWKANLAGMEYPATPMETDTHHLLLSEDYVTALAEDADGHLYIGHRQTGLGQYDEITEAGDTPKSHYSGFVDALLVTHDGRILIGTYGDGLKQTTWNLPTYSSPNMRIAKITLPPLPLPAKPPTVTQLTALLKQVQSLNTPLQPGQAVYLGEDWQTQGDWVGRYGRQYAVLCAARSPLDQQVQGLPGYNIFAQLGPHRMKNDNLRHWVQWLNTNSIKVLYDPIIGSRREAEWDDHGETYNSRYAGPNIWITVTVPSGIHRVSIYEMNKDGHEGNNRFRDYMLEIKPYENDINLASQLPTLAQARVRNFWNGVYDQFVICGPSKYYIKVCKNDSLNTIVNGVFIDKISGPSTIFDGLPLGWMGGIRYNAPNLHLPTQPDPYLLNKLLTEMHGVKKNTDFSNAEKLSDSSISTTEDRSLALAKSIWASLDEEASITSILQQPTRILAYRVAYEADASKTLQENWRWKSHIWTPIDREKFEATMRVAYQALLAVNPSMKGQSY